MTRVTTTEAFDRQFKRLARKYRSAEDAVEQLKAQLRQDERPGIAFAGAGYDVYKVRLPNRSASRGKSGGFRVVYYVHTADSVILISIYSKTEQADMHPANISWIVSKLLMP